MDEQKKKQIILIASIGVGVIVLAFLLFFLFFKKNQTGSISLSNTNSSTDKSSAQKNNSLSAPQFSYHNVVNNAVTSISTPTSLGDYTFKTHFSADDVSIFAKQLGISSVEQIQNSYIGSNTTDSAHMGYLLFDKNTGQFAYESYGFLKSPDYTSNQSPQEEANHILYALGVGDPTVTCPITYHKTGNADAGVTYVECHRDWGKVGAAVLNPLGILNMPLANSLASLTIGGTALDTPSDSTITDVTGVNNADGKARSNDFNTATIGIRSDGRIVSIVSNLRWLASESPISSSLIKTPDQALSDFTSHKQDFLLTIPDGTGTVDWKKVYPNNQAYANYATVTDLALSYVEKPSGVTQTEMTPEYMFRGYATLNSGYIVRFVATVPAALPKTQARALFDTKQQVAGAETTAITPTPTTNQQLQLNTFTPQQPNHSTQPTQNTTDQVCNTGTYSDQSAITLSVPGYGDVEVQNIPWVEGSPEAITRHTFFIVKAPTQSIDSSQMQQITAAFYHLAEEQAVINVAQYLVQNPQYNTDTKIQNVINQQFASAYSSKGAVANYLQDIDNLFVQEEKTSSIQSMAQQPDVLPGAKDALSWVFSYVPGMYEKYGSDGSTVKGFSSCYITGYSPSLFFSGINGEVHVSLPSNITYKEPPAATNRWDVFVENGTVHTSIYSTSFLYYEYNPATVHFTSPKSGFVVKINDMVTTLNTIAEKLTLTQREKVQFINEVQNAVVSIHTPYLKISFADQTEVNSLLPLHITPTPHTLTRVHVLLKPLSKPEMLPEPVLSPIERNGFTVLEIGASVEE